MAAGQYVKTYTAAVRQGARQTVLAALAGGVAPSAALETRFPSLPHDVAVNLSRQLSRGAEPQATRAGRALAAEAAQLSPATIIRVPALPVPANYFVGVIYEDSDGVTQRLVVVISNLPADATWSAIEAAALDKLALLASSSSAGNTIGAVFEASEPPPDLPPPVLLRAEYRA